MQLADKFRTARFQRRICTPTASLASLSDGSVISLARSALHTRAGQRQELSPAAAGTPKPPGAHPEPTQGCEAISPARPACAPRAAACSTLSQSPPGSLKQLCQPLCQPRCQPQPLWGCFQRPPANLTSPQRRHGRSTPSPSPAPPLRSQIKKKRKKKRKKERIIIIKKARYFWRLPQQSLRAAWRSDTPR